MPGPKLACGGNGQPACPPENASGTYTIEQMPGTAPGKWEKEMREMKKSVAVLFAIALIAVGCRAQVPPATSHVVSLTWTAPAANSGWSGCTSSAPCVYAVYRCSAGATTCADTTQSAWKEITSSTTRPSGMSYTDNTASGLTAYYIVETVQAGSNSAPSNTTTPITVPGSPLAPSLSQPTVAMEVAPQVRPAPPTPDPQLAEAAMPMRLRARLAWR
jgi:hypothetical protein